MPSPADLVTLAQAQGYIGASTTGQDVKLGSLITSISLAIRRMTDCVINPSSFTESYDGSPLGITLRNWPVIAVSSVTVMPCGYFGIPPQMPPPSMVPSVNGSNGYILDVQLDPQASTPQMIRSVPAYAFPKGAKNVQVSYTAGYQITGEVAQVPAEGGQVTAQQPYGAWSSDQSVSYASGGALTPVAAGSEAQGRYSVSAGAYTFSAADAGVGVLISYGYVPADIANAALEWISDRLSYQGRVGIASKTLASQETISYRITDTPAFVKAMLQPFTNVVPIG